MQPVFSIIIPCYNHGGFLKRAISSIEKIESVSFEIIIIDDGSTDENTITTLQELEKENYHVIRQSNAGPGAARNNGIRNSKGKYIVPLDADDMIRAEYVDKAFATFENDENIHVVYSNFAMFNGASDISTYKNFALQDLLLTNSIGACVIFRKTAWETVGGYDETLRRGLSWEDWDLWLNFCQHNFKFQYLDMIGYDYYYHSNSRERELLKDKTKVNYIISYFEEKYMHFYTPSAIHNNIINQIRQNPLGLLFKIVVATYLPKYYQKLVQKGRIRKYLC